MQEYYIYSGAIHIHSTWSDGSKSIPEIAAIADSVNLDYLLMADHQTLEGLKRGQEKKYGRTHVLIGCELNDPDNENLNHYLVFNIDEEIPRNLKPSEYIREVKKRGGMGFIAHPDEVRGNLVRSFPGNPWIHWENDEFDGIEIWNQMSEWMERLTPLNKLWMTVSPRKGIYQPCERTLAKWDLLNSRRKVIGVGGIDVHAMPYKIGPLTLIFFPYKIQFQSIRTNIILPEPLSQDFPTAKQQIYQAIRQANTYIYNHRWGEMHNLPMHLIHPSHRTYIPGDQLTFGHDQHLVIELPSRGKIRLLNFGYPIYEGCHKHFKYPISSPGNYRLEVYRKHHGWLFTNNIYIRPE